MSGETVPSLPDDFGRLRRGPFTYFPVVPGRLEFAIGRARSHAARRAAAGGRGGTAGHARRGVPPGGAPAAADVGDLLRRSRTRKIRRSTSRSSRRDPFTEAIRTAPRNRRADRVHRSRCGRASASARRLSRYLRAAPHRARQVRGGVSRLSRSRAPNEIERHADGIAWKLQGADPLARVMVVVSLNLVDPVLDAMERPQAQPMARRRREGVQLVNPHPGCLAEDHDSNIRSCRRATKSSARADGGRQSIDRRHVQLAVFREAEKIYEKNTGERVAHWQRRLLARYTRNLALTSQRADGVAVRSDGGGALHRRRQLRLGSLGDRRLAIRIRRKSAMCRPCISRAKKSGWTRKKIRLRRRLAQREAPAASGRPEERERRRNSPASGRSNWTATASAPIRRKIWSIEDYGRFLKKKGKSILSEERSRDGAVHHFAARRHRSCARPSATGTKAASTCGSSAKVHGEVGSVVVIFDEDRDGRYPYMTTWLGEHQNESDMAFYSTYPFDNMVGPGIGRGEYGGFLMSLPARRMYDVWGDPDYDFAENKPERLLLAGTRLFAATVMWSTWRPSRRVGISATSRRAWAERSSTFRSASYRR